MQDMYPYSDQSGLHESTCQTAQLFFRVLHILGIYYFIHCWNDNDHLVLCSITMTITHVISTCPTKYHLLTCSRWTDESAGALEKHEQPQDTVESLQSYSDHNGGDVKGHHAANNANRT